MIWTIRGDILRHEASIGKDNLSMSVCLYTEDWNEITGDPVGGLRWFSESEAREAFERSRPLDVVGLREPQQGDEPVNPLWVIGFGYGKVSPWVRVRWFSPKRSVMQLNDYKLVNGRLFCALTSEYAYRDDDRRHGQSECKVLRTLHINTDTTGLIEIVDKEADIRKRADVRDIPVDSLWMDFPEFGHWDQLADRHFGFETESLQ